MTPSTIHTMTIDRAIASLITLRDAPYPSAGILETVEDLIVHHNDDLAEIYGGASHCVRSEVSEYLRNMAEESAAPSESEYAPNPNDEHRLGISQLLERRT